MHIYVQNVQDLKVDEKKSFWLSFEIGNIFWFC